VFQSVKRQREYPGYRKGTPEVVAGSGSSMPILIGAAMIAAAILLSTLITALGSRYAGFESPTDETAWLVDRLTGTVYKCQARESGKASCEAEIATGSVDGRPKH
jgi:ethanolamine utilization microcompartment shell protein EutL